MMRPTSKLLLWLVFCLLSIGQIHAQTAENEYYIVSVSPDETMVAALSTNQTLEILDAQTGELRYELKGLEVLSMAVAWRPDSLRVAAASFDGKIRIWCTDENLNPTCIMGELEEQIDVGGLLRALSWNSKGNLASGAEQEGDSFWVWDSNEDFRLVGDAVADVYKISAHPTEDKFAVATLEAITILAPPFEFISELGRFSLFPDSYQGWMSVAWSNTGSLIAGGLEDGKFIL